MNLTRLFDRLFAVANVIELRFFLECLQTTKSLVFSRDQSGNGLSGSCPCRSANQESQPVRRVADVFRNLGLIEDVCVNETGKPVKSADLVAGSLSNSFCKPIKI